LDGANVAHLFAGEYTTFWVEAGNHTIGVRLAQRWTLICIFFPFCVYGPEQVPANWFKSIDLECRPDQTYSYGIKDRLWPLTDRMLFHAFTDPGEDYRLEEKTFVQPYVE
jgi:hypothetical protein